MMKRQEFLKPNNFLNISSLGADSFSRKKFILINFFVEMLNSETQTPLSYIWGKKLYMKINTLKAYKNDLTICVDIIPS